ncbi:hypothetical protein [Amycolatopsis sp. YIM 10]|uniref:hypothetical protein n=1 Tax=Amycolatopsis sp. YIM 10 TaxID=2653857 RepID=UPI00129018E7|nr:hypothetical protein [Amycolatopsis sp. YIM 10]QFU90941.1 hypothetical protein YIM_28845 [Amycolatopsis sp. YIM 10]
MTETYQGWWDVPAHLLTKTALGELEFPRTCEGRKPDAFVEARDWRDRKALFALFDVRECPPTAASAAQLDTAQRRRVKTRACQDCGARCQQPLTTVGEHPVPARLCPACRHIALLRREQTRFAEHRARIAADVAAVLTGPPAVLLQLDLHEPPRTERGSRRPVTAARIQVADLDGTTLLDLTLRLVGPRAKWVPDGAIDKAEGLPRVREAIAGKRLVVWSADEVIELCKLDPDCEHPSPRFDVAWAWPCTRDCDPEWLTATRAKASTVEVRRVAAEWRGEVDPQTRLLVRSLPPGTPDRLALLIHRIATTDPADKEAR